MSVPLDTSRLLELLSSPSWREFQRSVAAGLGVSLSLCHKNQRLLVSDPPCPWCAADGDGKGPCDGYYPDTLAVNGQPVLVRCRRDVVHAVCHLAGDLFLDLLPLPDPNQPAPAGAEAVHTAVLPAEVLPQQRMDLVVKARAARSIIARFVMANVAATTWGRRGLELSAVQEITQTIISLLRFGNPTLDKALDLILNCTLILLDAEGGWLTTNDGITLVRGNVTAVRGLLASRGPLPPGAFVRPVGSYGQVGVLFPNDQSWVGDVLMQLADQAQIVLEADRLHRTVQRQHSVLLEALDGGAVLTNRLGQITFINLAAEDILGRALPELFGQHADQVLPLAGAVNYTLTTGRRHAGRNQQVQVGAGGRCLDWSTIPVRDLGEIVGCLLLLDDRTQRVHRSGDAAQPCDVLAISRDPAIRSLIGVSMSQGGVHCLTVESLPLAAEQVRQLRPGVLVVDAALPGGATQAVRALQRLTPHSDLVLLTDREGEAELAEARTLGLAVHMQKPVDGPGLVELIRQLLAAGGRPGA